MNRFIIVSIFLMAFGAIGIAQSNNEENLHYTYYYTVDNVQSETQLDEVYSAIEQIKFVSKVKLNYKPEKPSMAQYIVFISEPKRTSEAQIMFQPTDLKKVIVDNDLNVTDLKISEN